MPLRWLKTTTEEGGDLFVVEVWDNTLSAPRPVAATLGMSAEQRRSEFNAQELANAAWAFATVGHSDEKLFAALGRAAEQRLSEFSAQGLANAA